MYYFNANFFLLLSILIGGPSLFGQSITVGTLYNHPNSEEGYTLFSTMGNLNTYLINNCGQVVNKWQSNYQPGLSAYLHTDGTLYRSCRINNASLPIAGLGGRFERYDWSGSLLWSYNYTTANYAPHHDFEIMPNGNILMIVVEKKTRADAIAAGRDSSLLNANEFWTEAIIELQPIGQDSAVVVWEWHAWDHLIQDFNASLQNYGPVEQHPELIDINFTGGTYVQDWLHANSVDYNPFTDQIAIGIRNTCELWVIDHSTSSTQAASHSGGRYGKGGDLLYRWGNPAAYRAGDSTNQKLFYQHNVHWVNPEKGQLMVYNNGGARSFSSIDIIQAPIDSLGFYQNPAVSDAFLPDTLFWTYQIPQINSSGRLSSAQRLPNGNTLICSGNQGYFFEIDSTLQDAWAYLSPVAANGIIAQGSTPTPSSNQVFNCTRYLPNFVGFTNKDLTPGNPIETNFDISHCQLPNALEPLALSNQNIKVFPNPASEHIWIQAEFPINSIKVFNIIGELIYSEAISNKDSISLSLEKIPSGIYFLTLNNAFSRKINIVH